MMKVLVVGSARQSTGGVASVIRLCEAMPMWKKYSCYWLGTQAHGKKTMKIWLALKAYCWAIVHLWRYDIVHFHTTPDKLGLLIQLPILLLSKIGRKKSIMHIHVGNQLNYHTRNRLFIWWMNHVSLVVLLSYIWEKLIKEKYPFVTTPTTTLFNPMKELPFTPMEQKEKTIIYVGSLNPNKAPGILIDAWNKIHNRHPEWRVKFMGGSILLDWARERVKELGLVDTVEILGHCKGEMFEKNFIGASIYVMCSYNEGFPMSVIEAWAYGAAVTSTPVGGLPDVTIEGKNCLTYNFGDSNGLADNLEELISNEQLRKNMSIYSHRFVYDNFSVSKVSNDYDFIYQHLT